MLEFSERFTIDSSSLTAGDLQALRDAGFTDKQALDIVLACGYRHYITRIADTTGAELDPEIASDDEITAAYSYERAASLDAADMTDLQRTVIEVKASGAGLSEAGPWCPIVAEPELPGEARAVSAQWRDDYGFAPGLFPALSLHPRALVATHEFLRGVSFGATSLGERRENMIAVVICTLARSPSMALLYADRLRRQEGGSVEAVLEAINWRDASLDATDKALLEFVEQVTVDCSPITLAWIDSLRGHGFDDGAILDVSVEAAALNCFLRIANALGVPPDDALTQDARLVEALRAPR